MWATNAPQSDRGKIVVVIAIDGTHIHNRSFVHFSVGGVPSSLPYGSCVFVHGPGKRGGLRRLSSVGDLNKEIREVQASTHVDNPGFDCGMDFVMIADGDGLVASGECKGWTAAHPMAVACWLCGRQLCIGCVGRVMRSV
mmetsp:Transcript_74391/g.123967  ORF Transcript_74391/g.123967 Transcript_74391/m.123967 type:complete len:140 (+) Transcript_74391:249-668(+)